MKLNKILIVFILILIVPIMGCSNDEISNSNTNIHSNSKTLSSYSDEQYEEYKNQELEYESKEKEYEYDKENYSQTIYVGSQNSDKYHIPECEWANKIHSNNLIEFSSKEEAENMGYKPCRVCNP